MKQWPDRRIAHVFGIELLIVLALSFQLARSAVAPLRAKSEPAGSRDFVNLWSGQAVRLARRGMTAGELTRALASEALAKL